MFSLKITIWAIIFIITNGAVFADYFKDNKILSAFAGLFAMVSGVLLIAEVEDKTQTVGIDTILIYLLIGVVFLFTVMHSFKRDDVVEEVEVQQPKNEPIKRPKTKATSNPRNKFIVEDNVSKILKGRREDDNDYNQRIKNTIFLAGEAREEDYNANSQTIKLKIDWNENIKSVVKHPLSFILSKLSKENASLLFDEKGRRDIYVKLNASNAISIVNSLLIYEDKQYILDYKNIIFIDGLIVQDEHDIKPMTWDEANEYAKNLVLGGYTNWRLPTKDELLKIYENRDKLRNYEKGWYWTSTKKDASLSWVVDFISGNDNWINQSSSYFVRCVQ